MKKITLSLWIFLHCAVVVFASGLKEITVLKDEEDVLIDDKSLHDRIKYNMRKSLDLEQEGCYLQPGKKECLRECGFNVSAKTILIIHGWTMSGMFESWMQKLVSAVMQRESDANVVIVDWLTLAHQLYPDAVNHTHRVGQSIATLLNWLKVGVE